MKLVINADWNGFDNEQLPGDFTTEDCSAIPQVGDVLVRNRQVYRVTERIYYFHEEALGVTLLMSLKSG